VERTATAPPAALAPCVADRNGDVGGVHGAAPTGVVILRGRPRGRRGCDAVVPALLAASLRAICRWIEATVILRERPSRYDSSSLFFSNSYKRVLPQSSMYRARRGDTTSRSSSLSAVLRMLMVDSHLNKPDASDMRRMAPKVQISGISYLRKAQNLRAKSPTSEGRASRSAEFSQVVSGDF
jgi:hypothetical protein